MIALVQVLIAAVLIPFAFAAAPSVSIERPGLITIRPSIRLPVTKDGACGARAGFGCGSEGCCSRHRLLRNYSRSL
ncbi:hypothetical protein BASA84_001147 [Batrachochytrium salamandrivorans]|nr:hypothetical protein BASA84_001147 [Batrachochytrium salamandrivorans]